MRMLADRVADGGSLPTAREHCPPCMDRREDKADTEIDRAYLRLTQELSSTAVFQSAEHHGNGINGSKALVYA